MPNVILNNTSSQISQTIFEHYKRLTGNYSGPCLSSLNDISGFLIQKGDGNSGIYVSNCAIDFYVNKLDLSKNSSNVNLLFSDNNCFVVKNVTDTSYLYLDPNGNLAISNAESNSSLLCNGLQIANSKPTLNLIDVSNQACHEINFLNSSLESEFYIKNLNDSPIRLNNQNAGVSSSLEIKYNCALTIHNGLTDLFNASGNYLTIGCSREINTGYQFYVNSISHFNNDLTLNNGFLSFSSSYISGGNSNLKIDGCLNVCKNLCVTGEIRSIGTGYFYTLNSNTGQFACLTGINNLLSCCAIFTGLNVSGDSLFSGSATFLTSLSVPKINLDNLSALELTGVNLFLSGNANVSGGSFKVIPTGNVTHCIYGQCLIVCTTGNNNNLIIRSYPSFLSGFCSSGKIITSGIDSFSTERSNISGSLGVSGFIASPCVISTECISGTTACFSNYTYSCCTVTCNFCQTKVDTISCFLSTGLNIGYNCTGYVNARNTAKAWGSFSISNNTIFCLTGYNVSNVTYNASNCYYNILLNNPLSCYYSMSVDLFTTNNSINQYYAIYNGTNTPLTFRASNLNCVSYNSSYFNYSQLNTNWVSSSAIYSTTFAIEGLSFNAYSPSFICTVRPSINWMNGYNVSFIIF